MKYEKGHPSEIIAVTGKGVDDVKLVSKGIIWPFQNVSTFWPLEELLRLRTYFRLYVSMFSLQTMLYN